MGDMELCKLYNRNDPLSSLNDYRIYTKDEQANSGKKIHVR